MDLNKISEETIKRYSNRYDSMGRNIRTLGWGSEEQQVYRFEHTLNYGPEGKSVLDIGCGFGDYYKFLSEKGIAVKSYTGWDINENFVKEGKTTFPGCDFEVVNISKDEELNGRKESFDAGVMLGLLNFNLGSAEVNYEYSRKMVTNAYNLVKEVLVVDFLSTVLTKDYPKEDFVFYHDPAEVLRFALTLSDNVVLKHDYAPIPQKEFMIYIYK